MTTLSLNLITDIQSTPRTEGEVVHRGDFLADTSQFEVFADTDCIVTLCTDLHETTVVMEFFELSSTDTQVATLFTPSGKPIMFKQPATATEYRYIQSHTSVTSIEVLLAILLEVENVATQLQSKELCIDFANTYVGKVGKEIIGTVIFEYIQRISTYNTYKELLIINKIVFKHKTL